MINHANSHVKEITNDNIVRGSIKYKLIFSMVLALFEILYFTFLITSNNLYITSIILNIIKFVCILILFISTLFVNPYKNIRVSLKSTTFFKTEKNLVFIGMIFSIFVVVVSLFSNIIHILILTIIPQCPYLKSCEFQKINIINYKADYYYLCNYKPNKNFSSIDITSCVSYFNFSTFNKFKDCKNVYKCELTTTKLEKNIKNEESLVLFFGILLFFLWLIIMSLWIDHFRKIKRESLLTFEKTPIKYELNLIKSRDNYSYVLCEHNMIEDNCDFNYDNIVLILCDQHEGNKNEDTMRLNRRSITSRSYFDLSNSVNSIKSL